MKKRSRAARRGRASVDAAQCSHTLRNWPAASSSTGRLTAPYKAGRICRGSRKVLKNKASEAGGHVSQRRDCDSVPLRRNNGNQVRESEQGPNDSGAVAKGHMAIALRPSGCQDEAK